MKTHLILLALICSFAFPAGAAETPKPPCCAPSQPAAAPCCAELKSAAPLPTRSLYQLETNWTTDAGATLPLASLRGQPVLIAMFFAQCEYACPMLVADLQRVRSSLPAEVRARTRIVLASFDTVRDTPAALRAYRERLKLDDAWTLLRGETTAVQELAMLLGVKFKQEATGQFAHSNLITLLTVDGEVAHQRQGLQGDVSELARAVEIAAK
ncbi:MAG: hypothetical protein RIQ93_3174 [Verrucomicrobiota bacterium]|jgi:protein SCO1/2